MTDKLVVHRFIQVHQACEQVDQDIWTLLADKTNATLAISHLCEKLVNSNRLDYNTTLQNLLNLVLISDDLASSTVYIRAIAYLVLTFDKNNRPIEFTLSKQSGKGSNAIVHPFIVIIKQKPSLYFNLLDELDSLFMTYDYKIVLNGMHRFVQGIFFTKNSVSVNALTGRLFMHMNQENAERFYQLFNDILHTYPLRKPDTPFFCLWNTLSFIKKTYQLPHTSCSYTLMDRLLTIVEDGQCILAYLNQLALVLDQYDFDIAWTSLSFALLKVQTTQEQEKILSMMECIMDASASQFILRVAYVPFYQILAESNDKQPSPVMLENKQRVLKLILFLDNEGQATVPKSEVILPYTYGMLGRLLCHLQAVGTLQPDTTALSLLFNTPLVFTDNACTVYSRIAELSCLLEPCYKFPVLLFFLRGLQVTSNDASIVTHLFRTVIPSLVNVNDPIITSKVLQVLLSAINNSGQDSSMASLGVKALARTCEFQPRVWQELKKVFTEWVLRRKSGTVRRKIDLSVTGPIKMELIILTTMRDMCQKKPKAYASDILPMIISLLQTCQDLSMASLSIMVDIITACVETGLVESRSIWNITVVYLAQFAFAQGIDKSMLLVKSLCQFYAIAGAKKDVSEPYILFKEFLLKEFIAPLLDSDHKEATSHALLALSSFSAQDLTVILPEKAMDYITTCKLDKNQHRVLATLMSSELDHMRRGLFKEETKQHKVTESTEQYTNDSGQVVGQYETEMQSAFVTGWEQVRVAPGLRSGYANAMLHILDSEKTEPTMESITKTKWYRHMVTLFTDVSLTDHLLVRISSIKSWQAFFKHALKGAENDMETIVQHTLKDLLSRLERSTVPGVTCNITLAMTGLVSMIRFYVPSFAASCAADIIEVLIKNYIVLSGSPLSHSIHLMSEEVQFAARFALGHLAAFVISNENLIATVYTILMDSAVGSNNKSRNIDTAVDLVQFANGYAAGHCIGALATWPTVTDTVKEFKAQGMSTLLHYCKNLVSSDSRVLGIMMGLASKLNRSVMKEELSFATDNLKHYLSSQGINKGLLFGSVWLASIGVIQENGIDVEISGLIESVMTAAASDVESAQHFYHFSVPFAHIQLYHYLFTQDEQRAETNYWNAFEPLLTSIDQDEASSHYRIASLFSLGSLLGVNYINTNDDQRIFYEAEKYKPELRQRALDKLAFVSGLHSRSAPVGNLKSGRIAAAVCGKVIESARNMMHALNASTEGDTAASESLLSASSEPVSYSRLNNNTSYIRAVFDRLVVIASDTQHMPMCKILLDSLIATPGPLPPVNWFSLVTKLSKLSNDLYTVCFTFCSTHATSSLSLSEFLLTQMSSSLGKPEQPHRVIVDHVGVVLELAGLPRIETRQETKRRGMAAVVKRITISESRALEILLLFGQRFKHFDYTTQLILLENLQHHLPANDTTTPFIVSIRQLIMKHMTQYALKHTDVMNPGYNQVVRKAVACSVTEIGQISPGHWDQVSSPEGHMIALTEYYQLVKKQEIVKHLSAALVHLIGMDATTPQVKHLWDYMAEMIRKDTKDRSGWMIRVLDAYVVYIGALSSDNGIINVSLAYGLSCILSALEISTSILLDQDVKNLDMTYSFGTLVMQSTGNEQEQIVRRLFKLFEMTATYAIHPVFNRLLLSLPALVVVQNETKYCFIP